LTLVATAGIPALYGRSDVASLLGTTTRELTWWIYALSEERRYREFEIAKRAGGEPRLIRAPIKPIKDLQRRLADVLLEIYEPRAHVHGFVSGRSPLTNAQQHEGQRWVLKVDIADFFPSINFGRVRGMFLAFPFEFPGDVATTLAQLCCHRNELPQGAPTSPIVSNIICLGLDRDLARLARSERCRFTRYADDICFSTNHVTFPSSLATIDYPNVRVGDQLASLITRHGFRVKAAKTRLVRRSRRQRVTGLVVNRKANIPSDYTRSLRNLLYIWRAYGEADAAAAWARFEEPRNRPHAKGDVNFKQLVRGRVQYVGSVKGWTNDTYLGLAKDLAAVDDQFKPRTTLELTSLQRVRIYTEGESDIQHLLAAHRYFLSRGEFKNLEIEVPADASAGGDTKLLAKSEELAAQDQPNPCICIFDRDNEEVLRKAVGGTYFRQRGDNVAALAISPPDWRDQRIFIEMLYPDEDLNRRDEHGRRLYLSEEFNSRTGQHASEEVHVTHPDRPDNRRKLVREEVFPFGTRRDRASLSF
jgi:RNA-directed DNA polymerase